MKKILGVLAICTLALAGCSSLASSSSSPSPSVAPSSASPKAAASSKAPAPAASHAASTALSNNGWTVVSTVKVTDDGTGSPQTTLRIKNDTGNTSTGASFTVTLLQGNTVAATLSGVANTVAAGEVTTVQFISTDPLPKGPYTVAFQATSF